MDEDIKLMLKVKGGDNSAFEVLLSKYHRAIINFIYRFIYDKDEAEDLASEVFLRIYRARKNYTPRAKFSTYIYQIAKNLALNELRRKGSHKESSLDEILLREDFRIGKHLVDNKPSALIELEKEEIILAVKRAIDSLPKNQKMAVVLRRYDELSYEEIARIMGCSVSAVKSLLNRAKITLKEKLYLYIKNSETFY